MALGEGGRGRTGGWEEEEEERRRNKRELKEGGREADKEARISVTTNSRPRN